tara:strand:+ start:424 stop:588 length:165 start_codon:yes stop_codon:yes gene_type:complete
MDFDFDVEKPKRLSYKKPKYWVQCLDCDAILSDRVADRYMDCPFCDGANWSSDK